MQLYENVGRLRDDECQVSTRELQNSRMEEYNLYDQNYDFACQKDTSKCLQDFAVTNRRVYREGYGPNPCDVDKQNALLHSELSRERNKVQLCPRTFGGVPAIGAGIVMPEVEDRIKQGEMRYSRRTCDSMNPLEASVDTFIPLVPCLQKVIQNPDFIVPTWTRGGIPTRDVDQQRQFLNNSGYIFDGKVWQKQFCGSKKCKQ